MSKYEEVKIQIRNSPKTWLITGVAGFIGSHLLETLLKANQRVVGLDNFATGYQSNLNEVENMFTKKQWANFKFIDGDIRSMRDCVQACEGIDYVLHQAALGSVPRSLVDPIACNDTNVNGFLNILLASRNAKVKSFTYAASSSTYGDHLESPKVEERMGKLLSPYALTKYVNELYADVFARSYGFNTIGLRYFNVFGPRQDPNGAYAAVIPLWASALIKNEPIFINGDGKTSRDYTYVANVVQANILAATALEPKAINQIYNIAVGKSTTLNDLLEIIRLSLNLDLLSHENSKAKYRSFRDGDVLHSLANIDKAKKLLGYEPSHEISIGIAEAMKWYKKLFAKC